MSLTHKKKFKKQIVNNNIFSKLKKKNRDLKYIGGADPNNILPPSKRQQLNLTRAESVVSSGSNYSENENGELKPAIDSMMNVNKNIGEFASTNTRFILSELKSNPFYAKKSTNIVENKKMYNLNTNYLMHEIKKKQLADPNFIVTSEIISSILAEKEKVPDSIQVDYIKQQELHNDFCDFE